VAIDSTLIHIDYVFLFVNGHCLLIVRTFSPFTDLAFRLCRWRSIPLSSTETIVILLQKSILDGVEERGKEVEDMGEFSFDVSPKFFDGIEVRKVGRQVNQGTASGLDGLPFFIGPGLFLL
jgi:hypothetical protein